MAIDVYLPIDGIKGKSTDCAHAGWIEVTSAQWGARQPKSTTASTGGDHTAERCEHKSIALTKLADRSSPILMQTCSSGRTIPKSGLHESFILKFSKVKSRYTYQKIVGGAGGNTHGGWDLSTNRIA